MFVHSISSSSAPRRLELRRLFEHLRTHPEVYLPPGKERHFFDRDEIYDAGWSNFAADAFAGAPEGVLWGDVTPGYMAGCPTRVDRAAQPRPSERTETIIPERIRATCPDVKLVAILRDPVERCISHYRMSALGGSRSAQGSPDQVMANLLAPAALEDARRIRRPGFITWGEYGRILEGVLRDLPPTADLCLLHEGPGDSPAATHARPVRFPGCRHRLHAAGSGGPVPGGGPVAQDRVVALPVRPTEDAGPPAGRALDLAAAAGEPPATRDTAPPGGKLPVRPLEQTGARIPIRRRRARKRSQPFERTTRTTECCSRS